jgi:hypothetical protein
MPNEMLGIGISTPKVAEHQLRGRWPSTTTTTTAFYISFYFIFLR